MIPLKRKWTSGNEKRRPLISICKAQWEGKRGGEISYASGGS